MSVWEPLPHAQVSLAGGFWEPRLRTNREATIPHVYGQCRDTGRIDAFRGDAATDRGPQPHFFWDSDVAKWVEAASHSLASHPDPGLEALLEPLVALIAAAQMPDGYLNTYFTRVEPAGRWTDTRDAHELYCAGHLIEAAVAHFRATGRRTLLDVARRYADHIGGVFGTGPGQRPGYGGHEEVELALVALYRATGEQRHLDLARYFVEQRGQTPHWFSVERQARGTPGHFEGFMGQLRDAARYNQSHAPARTQGEAVGHAVRAMYLYCALADLATEPPGDAGLWDACLRLWEDVVGRHMYITGGVGSSAANEGFTTDFDLPNETAYAETCAAVGLVLWAHRLLRAECDARYADVLERALYNGVLSGVGLGGRRFFYANPLASDGGVHRQDWFGCACCPPNVARLLASLGAYAYSTSGEALAVHLYGPGELRWACGGRPVRVIQHTDYPWGGAITLEVRLPAPTPFELRLRQPGWCRGGDIRLNGGPAAAVQRQGYWCLRRTWEDGDRVEVTLPMPVERVHAHPAVRANLGLVALQRGPLVYCLEGVDNPTLPLDAVFLPPAAALGHGFDPELLGGVEVIQGTVEVADPAGWTGTPYGVDPPRRAVAPFRAVPYCVWDNRAPGAMRVWLREG